MEGRQLEGRPDVAARIDTYCTTPDKQKPVEETLDFLLHRLRVSL